MASHDPKPQQQEEIAVTQSVTESVVHDKNSPEIFPSPQKADLSFEQVEEETDENSEETYGDEEIENTDPIENRLGGKLLGVATPTGQKQLFNSPMLSKSGQKVYEKYNVHWR